MRALLMTGLRVSALLLGVAVATVSFGEPPPAGSGSGGAVKPAVLVPPREVIRPAVADSDRVYRMELYEGPNRTVRYFGVGATPSERAALNDLERAENEMDYLNRLQDLRRLYVNNELTLQPQRLYVQEQLYGTQISYDRSSLLGGFGSASGPGWNWGVNDYVSGYWPYGGWGGWGGGWGGGYGGGFGGALYGASTSVVRSLAYGMGDEGVLKNNLSQVIAQQAGSGEYADRVTRNYHAALAEASTFPRLAVALGLKKGEAVGAAGPPDRLPRPLPPVTLTLKGGEKIEGNALAEEGDWYVVTTPRGQTQVRKSEVTRIDRVKSDK